MPQDDSSLHQSIAACRSNSAHRDNDTNQKYHLLSNASTLAGTVCMQPLWNRNKGDITKVVSSMQEIMIAGGSLVEKLATNFKMEEDPPRRLG
jgi:hypothetical protein